MRAGNADHSVRKRLKPFGYVLAVSCFGGLAAVLTRRAVLEIPPFGMSFVRFTIGALLAYVFLRSSGLRVQWRNCAVFAPLAVLWAFNGLFFTLSLRWTNAATAQFIQVSVPVLTAVAAGIVLHQALSRRQWSGVTIAAIGIIIVVVGSGTLQFGSDAFTGNVFAILTALVFSAYIVGSQLAKFRHIHAAEMMLTGTVIGAVISLALAAAEYVDRPWIGTTSATAAAAMFGSAVFVGTFHTGFQVLVNRFGPPLAVLNLYVLPGYVLLWGAVLLGELPAAAAIAGAVLALTGVWFVVHAHASPAKHPGPHRPPRVSGAAGASGYAVGTTGRYT